MQNANWANNLHTRGQNKLINADYLEARKKENIRIARQDQNVRVARDKKVVQRATAARMAAKREMYARSPAESEQASLVRLQNQGYAAQGFGA